MRGTLLSKARLQDAKVLLEPFGVFSNAMAVSQPSAFYSAENSRPWAVAWGRSSCERIHTTACFTAKGSRADETAATSPASNTSNSMDFPGGRVPFTDQIHFEGGPFTRTPPLSCYRTLDSKGAPNIPSAPCYIYAIYPASSIPG